MKQITSVQNSYIKELLKLQDKSRERRKKKLFIIEGKREISLAIKGNYKIDTYLFVPDIFSKKDLELLNTQHATQIEISKDVYEKLAYRDSTEGIISVV
ncbi:RNA methyltransferase, partial [Tenacibaculum maritimum]